MVLYSRRAVVAAKGVGLSIGASVRTSQSGGDPVDEQLIVRKHRRLAHLLLVAVCVVYVAMIGLRTSQSMSFKWDEVVYLSQVARDVPAAMFSAPRSRGMSILLAPVAGITSAVFPIRIYIAIGSGLLMYLAFRPWLRIVPSSGSLSVFVPPLAAALFASLWLTLLYGSMAYPNLWLAFVLVAGTGYACVAVRQERIRLPVVAAITTFFALASLLRPTDTLVAAVPMLAAMVIVPAWRKTAPVVAVVLGVTIGWVVWIAEAFVRFGGPLQRLREGAETNEGRLTWSLVKHFEALDGADVLCRPHDVCAGIEFSAAAWWFVLPVLVGAGLYGAFRSGWFAPSFVVVGSALAVAVQYFVLIDYAAPRFLLPTYAYLALPVAASLLWLVGRPRPRGRTVAIAVIAMVLLAHLIVQQRVFDDANELLVRSSRNHANLAESLRREHGVRPPCLIVGEGVIQQGYLLKCRSLYAPAERLAEEEQTITAAIGARETVAVRLRADDPIPEFMADWRRVPIPGRTYVVYMPPE